MHGRSRTEAVHTVLASRGISIPEGDPSDPPDSETVNGLANRKQQLLLAQLEQHGVSAFEGARLYLELAHHARLPCAVVSGSMNTRLLLDRARLSSFIDEFVDGNTARCENLQRKPAPDGVSAGHAGHFELVVAVAQNGNSRSLFEHGADRIVGDLGEILERSLGS